jgi:glutamate-ammonia-ligase adenylyltransferase
MITDKAASDLTRGYGFLRRLEHRLQMVEDRQTHVLPKDEAGIRHIALFMGYDDAPSFVAAYLAMLRMVEEHYAHLFEEAPALGGPGNLVFTGSEDDPETIETLKGMGYAEPSRVAEIVRAWHRGRFRAMRSARAREILTELMPALLAAFAKTANPDAALLKFNEFLAALPAGVHLFSLLYQNPPLLELLAEVLGSAPRIADSLARNPALLEGVLGAEGGAPPDDPALLATGLETALGQARVFEDALDIVRRWNGDHVFRVGLAVLRNAIDAASAGPGLAAVAETAIRALHPRVADDFAKRHGRIPGRGMAIVGLGKLGGREMTFASDLDLMFVYDAPSATAASDGPAPLAATQYFARLGQRVIGAISAPTAEGKLYEVDMRLRPSGQSGPIATSMEAFARYHEEAAWTWEHMALTRARAIAGDEVFAREIDAAIHTVLTRRRDPDKLVFDVADMRARMERELTRPGDIWEVKHLRGGLVDVEFIVQYLELRHGADHPNVLDVNTGAALDKLARAGLIEAGIAEDLADALHLWRNVQGMLRLTTVGRFDAGAAPEGLRKALARAAGATNFDSVVGRIEAAASRVRRHFEALIEQQAARIAPAIATTQLEKEGRR